MHATQDLNDLHPALRVLVVEDDPDWAESLRLLLHLYGHRAEVADDGTAALAAARQFAPDVVLLDLGLPGMDGYEVARRLREQPTEKPPLLLAVTGYGEDGARALSAKSGIPFSLFRSSYVDQL